jgi:hypothetical protein
VKEDMTHPAGHTPKVMIIAGEASGDLHGSLLVGEMLGIHPGIHFYGIGGNKMKAAGVKLLAHAADIGVVGATEVFSKIGTFIRVIRKISRSMDQFKPDLVVLIDFPDFNLNIVARAAKSAALKFFITSARKSGPGAAEEWRKSNGSSIAWPLFCLLKSTFTPLMDLPSITSGTRSWTP